MGNLLDTLDIELRERIKVEGATNLLIELNSAKELYERALQRIESNTQDRTCYTNEEFNAKFNADGLSHINDHSYYDRGMDLIMAMNPDYEHHNKMLKDGIADYEKQISILRKMGGKSLSLNKINIIGKDVNYEKI